MQWKKIIINIWDKFNRLTITKELSKREHRRYVKCSCDCWKEIESVLLYSLTSGNTKSCGCLYKESSVIWKRSLTHWMSDTKIYKVFDNLLARCNRVNNSRYKNYWARWIKCEWEKFEDFYKDMWDSYKEWLQIDRIDNNWNYYKKNCRWVNCKTNVRNRSNTVYYKWIPLWEYCEKNWLDYKQTYWKIKRGTFN